MKTKILAMLLCVAILLSSLPMSVFAEEWKGSEEPEINAEIRGAESDENGGEALNEEEPGDNTPTPLPTNEGSGLDLIGEVITTGDNFRIRMNSDEVSYAILEYFGTARKVEVIKEYYGLPITKIGDGAFRNHPDLEEVTLPDTLVYVGESVFDGCSALKYNTIGGGNYIPSYENEYFYFAGAIDKSVETFTVVDGTVIVGAMSLYHYENLKSAIFPTSVIQMGYAAIGWCDALESVTLPFVGMDSKGIFNGQFGWAFGARTFGGNISYVPESLKTVVVLAGEAIAKGAFYGIDQMEALTVPFLGSSVDNEENAYFSYFWNGASYSDNIVPQGLKNVTISGGKLGYGAFYQCTRIETISLLNNVTSIGYSAFSDCSSLMNITIPNSVTIIGQYAFNNCTSLIDVTIPNGVTSIGGAAFSGCTALLSVTLGDNINSIGDYAFNNCISLMSIIIPNGVTNFGWYTFQNCSSLTSVSIGNSVTSIGQYTFQNCTSLTNITIADSVTTIGQYAFQGCTSLTSISLSNHLNSIEEYAFQNCKGLKSISIPDSVTNIEQNAFQNCTSLKSVYTPNLAKWCAISFGNYTANPLYYAEKLYIDETLVTSLVIPDDITSVGNYAFYNCKGLTSVIIKNSVTSIGEYTFYGCSGLTNISIPNSVLSIGQYAFRGCSGLTSVTLGSNVTSIGPHTFQNCTSLTSVTIPNSVDSIGEYAFYGCYKLASVTIGNAAASIGQYAFQDCTSLTGIIIPNSVESIGNYAFSGCSNLASAAIGNSVMSIGQYAFQDCTSLVCVIIPNSVENIGNYAFSGCSKLESMTIGNSVISIGQYAFQKCSVLNSIIIPNSVESIGKYAFSGCSALMTVTIGNNVTSIGEYAFQNCGSLYRVINNSNLVLTIASSDNGYVAYYAKILVEKDGGVAYIDDGYEYIVTTDEYLFQKKDGNYELIAYFGKNETVTLPLTIEGNSYSILRMRGVKNVIIPNGFTTIGDSAFSGCKSLVSITIPTSVTTIGSSAFYSCSSLTSINIPSSVTAIRSQAFDGCTALTSISIPNVNTIESYAFRNCTGLRSLIFTGSTEQIFSHAFENCTGLTSVIIPDTVWYIDNSAFSGCIGLISVTIGSSVHYIRDDAFKDCIKLIEIINKSSLDISVGSTDNGYVGYYAKNVCTTASARKTHTDSNGYITYSDGNLVSLIGYIGTSNELVLPTGITEIYQYAFNSYNILTSITIPATLTNVGKDAFAECRKLKSIYYTGDIAGWCAITGIGNLYWVTTNRVSYSDTGYSLASRTLYIQNKKVEGSLTIPNSVTSIGDYAFYNCDGLTSISIPDTITSIGSYAFKNCGLTSVIIPNSVTTIGNYAFQSCSDLLSATIGNKVMSMGSSIFSGCNSLTSITIPDSVTSIADYSFEYCRNLTSITIGNSVKTIGKYAFQECDGLASLTIPASVTSIGSSAFMGCDNLHTFYYEGDIAGWCAMSGLGNINSTLTGGIYGPISTFYIDNKKIEGELIIPDSVTSISANAFTHCSNLTSVTIGNNVKSIGSYAFAWCSDLTSVVIPNSVETISDSAFANCTGLAFVTMADSVTWIGSSAFSSCTNLTHVVLSKNLNRIYKNAFSGCSSLDEESSQAIDEAISAHGYESDSCLVAGTLITLVDGTQKKVEDIVAGDMLLTWDFLTGTYSAAPVVFNDAEAENDYTIIYVTFSDGTTIGIATEHGFFDVDLGKYVYLDLDAAQYIGHTFIDQQGKKVILENVVIKQERVAVYSPVTYQDLCYYANGMLSVPGGIGGLLNPFAVDTDTMQYDQAKMQEDIAIYGLLDYEEVSDIIPAILFESFNGQYLNILIGKDYISWETIYGLMERYLPLCEETTNSSKSSESVLFLSPKRGFAKAPENEDIDSLQFISNGNGTCFVASIGTYKDTAVIIPETSPMGESVTSIGDYAFSGCTTLTSITIPEGVTSIGMSAFAGCIALTSITVPNSLTNIGTNAFFGCTSLQYNQYSTIGNFTSTKYLGNATNPYLVLIQATASFISGTNYTISSGIKVIYDSAFSSYTTLTSITIPDSVTGIGANVFSNCAVLESITVSTGNHVYHSIGNCIIETASKTLIAGCKESIIPDDGNVKIIGEGAFAGCSQLTSITIPNSVTTIKSNAFANCTSLTSITYLGEKNEWRHVVKASNWDENTGDYGEVQFNGNSGLMIESNEDFTEFWVSGFRKNKENTENVTIDISSGYSGRPVTKIYAKAFNGQSGIVSIALPDTITAIGEYAFADCVDLESINLPNGISEISFSIFTGCNSLSDLAIPFLGQSRTDSKTAYLGYLFGAYSATENSNYVPSSLKNITIAFAESVSDYAFYGCSSLQTIVLPDMVTSIGDYAFSGCYGIALIDIPEQVTSIGDYAFSACTGLQALVIPDNVTSIGEMLLNSCNQVKSITIGASLNEIGEALEDQPLFGLNKSLSSLSQYIVSAGNVNYMTDSYGVLYRTMRIPYKSGDKYIAVSVVDAPIGSNLSGYRLPSHIVKIEPFAFAYHSSLRAMELENIRMICDHAFYEADNLVSVHFGETEKIDSEYWDYIETISYSQYVGDYAFMGCSALQKVNIETDMLVGIGDQAFYDCGKLSTVIIGKNIQAIGSLAFGKSYNGEASLEKFQVMEGSQHFTAIAGILYEINEDKTLTLVWYPALLTIGVADGKPIYATEFELPTEDDAGEAVEVSSIALYAFSTARMLENIVLDSTCALTVRDYAFSGTAIQSISIGENVVSLGTKRGEGEYTVFSDCNYLTDISVSSANAYYSSIDGVLFNKDQTKLIRYPEAKFGTSFSVPATVSEIASMAFKHSQSLQTITISSYVSSIGVEAFYLCSNLAVVFFDGVYAPRAVMENAFTTYFNPQTTIGYSALKYNDGEKINDYGWSNYEEVYSLQPMTEISDFHVSESNGYYAIVLVDEEGNRVKWSTVDEQGHSNFIVTLTDPNGISETVYAGVDEDGLGDGIAVFYDLYGAVNLGLSINFDEPYSLRVSDTTGAYYTFISDKFYLDYDMRITYITLVRKPCDLVFHANGGTGSSSTLDIEVGGTYSLPNSSFSRAGYTFKGWSKAADGQVEYTDTFYTDRYKDHFILYAIWEANTNTVHFNANKGTGSMSDFQIRTDEAKPLPTNLFVRDGYEFIGWAESSTGVAEYEDGSTYLCGPESEYTLYAKWRGKENLLVLHANGGDGSMDSMTVVTDETYNLALNTYTRAGYTFAGWATTADGTVGYLDGGEYTSGTAPVQHLYAAWEANTNTILFNANGGVGTMSATEGKTDSTISLPLVTFTRSGYLPIGLSNTPNGVLMYTNGGEYKVGTEAQTTLYVIWAKAATVYGVNCGEISINTQTATLNTAAYGKIPVVDPNDPLIDPKKGYVEGNIKIQKEISETIDISVIGYYDRGYLTIAQNACGLYQNGIAVPGCTVDQIDESTGTIYFAVPADALKAEVPIEARFAVTNGVSTVCSTALLNINVINFTVDESDVNLDTKDLSVDLSKSGDIIGKLLGSKSWNFNLGDNVSVGVDIDGDTATLSLNAAYSSSKDNTKDQQKKYTTNCEEGYYANLLPHNKGTWFFQKKIVMWENDGIIPHVYTMNIRFVSGTGAFGHYYYRCYIYEGDYKNQKALFYGAISSGNNMGRKICAIKANVIYATYAAKAMEAQDITKGFKYSEPIMPKMKLLQDGKVVSRVSSTKQDFSATLYGDIVFQYQAGKGLVPVSSYILGEIRYELLHKEQFVVWVIPIYLEVSVKLDGKIELSLKYDAWRSVSIDEAKMTLSAEITAKVGVGCELISVGVYGTIGTVFILDFAPTFGVEKWTVSGKLALYATFYTLTWKKWGWVWYPTVEQTTKEHTLFERTWTIIDNTGKVKSRSASTRMLSEMFLAKNYIVDTSENAVAEEARLVQIGNTLYKIYAANRFTESENPEEDDYNYRKIALAKWNDVSEEWEFCQFLDDNQFNDLAFDLYQTEDGVAVVFTQQTQMVEEGDDSYSYVSNLCVKYAWIDEDGTVTASALATSGNYKYLSTVSFVDGVPTVVWVENADNNIFGVSPYNYVDATGVSHIYETTANSVWMSQLIDGAWTEATCIQSGLSAVTDLAVTENGYVVYIVDENGDLADISDREAYYKGIESRKIRMLAGDDVTIVTSVVASGNGVIYYCQNDEGETLQFTDLVSNASLDLPEDASYLTDDYKVIYDETGAPAAILYSDALSWKENDIDCYGSTLYGIFRTEAGWGNPVEITTDLLSPSDNRYVSSFDAMFNEEGLLLFVEYSDRDGNCKAILMDTFTLGSRVSLVEQKVDYAQSLLTVTFENKGTEADGVYAMINGVSRMNVFDSLSSGEKQTETLDLSAYGRNLTITFYNTSDNSLIDTIELDLNHSDLQPIIKQLLLGKNNTLLVAVRNNGNLASDGTLYVVIGNENAETILKNEKTYADSFSAIAQNELIYKEIALFDDLQVDENTIVTIYVVASGNLEKGNCTENNLIYGTLKQFSSAVADDGSSYRPTIDVYQHQFDSQNPKDISIRYSCSENDSIVEILMDGETVSAGSYDLEDQKITLKKEYLATLTSGKEAHTLSLTFATGDTISVELQIPAYYTITWANEDGTVLDTTLVKEGQIPDTEAIPTKAEDEYGTYTFTGWMNGAENVKAADADTTYTAVYLNTAPIYSVTWVMMTDEGEFSVEELYEYGKSYDEEILPSEYVPEYKGTVWAPYGKQFSGWDKVVEPVTEDVVYTATYTKSKQGTATVTNSAITAVASKTFTTTVSLEDVHNMTSTTLTISYDATLVTLDHVVTGSKVSVIEMSEGQLILSVTGLSDGATLALADLTFRVSNDLEEGEYDILGVASEDDVTDELGEMEVVSDTDIQLLVDSKTSHVGKIVTVSFELKNATELKSIALSNITYDHTALEIVGGEWNLAGSILQNWNSENETAAIAFAENTDINGKIFTLTFRVKDNAENGEYPIGCSVTAKAKTALGAEESISILAVGGSISVASVIRGDVNDDDLVTSDDAIHVLYYTLLPDIYTVNQDVDFNGDGFITSDDAIYLLYHTLLPDLYPLH